MKYIFILLFVLCANLFAAKNDQQCNQLSSCINLATQLTGSHYVYEADLFKSAKPIKYSPSLNLTKDNIDYYVSLFLNDNGFSRVKLEAHNSYQIINSRDIRYHSTPILLAGKDQIPNSFDYVMVSLDLKSIKSSELTSSFRPFLSRYGRIIDVKGKNQIIIQDTATNISRLYALAQKIDTPLTDEMKKKQEKKDELDQELKIIRAKNCSDISDELNEIKHLIINTKKPNLEGKSTL